LKEWDSSLFKHFIKQLLCMFELTAKFQTTKHQCSIKSQCNLCVHFSDCITCRLIVNDIQHESFWISPPQPASLEKEWKERKEKKEKKKKKTSFLFSDFVSTGYSFFIHFYKNHKMKGKNEKTKQKETVLKKKKLLCKFALQREKVQNWWDTSWDTSFGRFSGIRFSGLIAFSRTHIYRSHRSS
jgi:hypothetical protein